MSQDVQLEAIQHTNSPLCVIAGPGTGKTTLLIQKIISLLSQGLEADSLLVLTFTQKAAEEMSTRVEAELGEPFHAKTYHSFFLELIENWDGETKNPQGKFTLLDDISQQFFFLKYIRDNNLLNHYGKISSKEIATGFQRAISLLKEHGINPEKISTLEFDSLDYKSDLLKVYAAYEIYKKENNFLDFGDLQLRVKDILSDSKIGNKIRGEYSYVLVDEFQDTNKLQFEIVLQLAKDNITVVGDPKQSIYGFRGTTQDSLELFSQVKKAKVLYLRDNFRSSSSIVSTLNNGIASFRNQKELLQSTQREKGEVSHIICENELIQQQLIIDKINEIVYDKNPKSIGILCRTKTQVREYSNILTNNNLEHRAPQLENFFLHPIVEEAISLLKVLDKPKEENVEFFKLLSSLHIREESLLKLSRSVSHYEKSYYELFKKKQPLCEFKHDNELLGNFFKQFREALSLKEAKYPLEEILIRALDIFNYYNMALIQGEFAIKQLNNFVRFVQDSHSIHNFKNLKELNSFIDIAKEIEPKIKEENGKNEIIEITTLHQSKGKEFDIVFIPHVNENKIPLRFTKQKFSTPYDLTKEEHIKEEERLFFVGISRAKERLIISSVKQYVDNKLPAKISSFLTPLKISPREFNSNYNKHNKINDASYSSSVEQQLIEQTINHLKNKKFSQAKERIDLLETLFSPKTSLKKFLGEEKELDEFKKRMNGVKLPIAHNLKKHIYSVSQLKTYQQCPKKYLFQYIYKIPTPAKYYFDFGNSLHKVLELIKPEIDSGLNHKTATLRALSLLSKNWESNSYKNAKEEQEFYDLAIECVKNYINKEFVINKKERKNLALEKKFYLTVDNKTIMGFIDRVDEDDKGIIIYDYKTSSSKEPQKELQENLQLYTYALATKEDSELKKYPQRMALWYLKHDAIDSVEFDEKVALSIKEKLSTLLESIEKENFTATPSTFACSFCDFNSICPDSKTKK